MTLVNTSPAPDAWGVAPPARRRSKWWWLLLLVPVVVVAGLVTLAVLSLVVHESSDDYVLAVESASVPAGAVLVDSTASDGTFEQGPEAEVTYHLAAGPTPVEACVSLLGELRSDGWKLDRWGTAPGPHPNEAEAFCAELGEVETPDNQIIVIFEATRSENEPIVASLNLTSEAPGGVALSYAS